MPTNPKATVATLFKHLWVERADKINLSYKNMVFAQRKQVVLNGKTNKTAAQLHSAQSLFHVKLHGFRLQFTLMIR